MPHTLWTRSVSFSTGDNSKILKHVDCQRCTPNFSNASPAGSALFPTRINQVSRNSRLTLLVKVWLYIFMFVADFTVYLSWTFHWKWEDPQATDYSRTSLSRLLKAKLTRVYLAIDSLSLRRMAHVYGVLTLPEHLINLGFSSRVRFVFLYFIFLILFWVWVLSLRCWSVFSYMAGMHLCNKDTT